MTEQQQPTVSKPEPPALPPRMDPVRKWVLIFGGFCVCLLAWYVLADRYTPFTTQARVNAFVVPIAPQVAGEVVAVDVVTNQAVKKGQLLAVINPDRYALAVAAAQAQLALTVQNIDAAAAVADSAATAIPSAQAQLALTAQNLDAATAAVNAAVAALDSAQANLVKERQNDVRLRRIAEEDPGAISQRRLEMAAASLTDAQAGVQRAQADLEKAKAQRGLLGEQNPQLRSARAAVGRAQADHVKALAQRGPLGDKNPQWLAARAALEKAQLDLQYTRLVAPNDGLVTDLRVDAGNFAATGQPLMTFVAVHKIWVEANLTENNLGHVKPGDKVDLVLDVWPDKKLRGRVRNITYGVTGAESTSKPGALPTVQNQRDWLRNAQRFPVLIDFEDPAEAAGLGARVGSQVNVLVHTGDRPILSALGRLMMWLSGLLSYAY